MRSAETHHDVSIGKCEQLFGTIEETVWKRLQARNFVSRLNLKRRNVYRDGRFGNGADSHGRSIGRNISATRSGNADSTDASGCCCRINLDAVHSPIGHKNELVRGIVDEVAMASFPSGVHPSQALNPFSRK